MPLNLSFSIEGEKQLSATLGIIAEGVTDYRKPLSRSKESLLDSFDKNFAQRGKLFGGWKPRQAKFSRGVRIDKWPLLEKRGNMRKGFVGAITGQSTLTLSNTQSYFKYHQSNKARKSNLPRRVMMKIDSTRRINIMKYHQEYLIGLLRSKGMR